MTAGRLPEVCSGLWRTLCTLCCKTLLNFAPGYCRNAYCIYSVPLPCIGRVLAAIDLIAGNLVSSSGQDLCSQGARVRASVKGTQKEKRGGCSSLRCAHHASTSCAHMVATRWRLRSVVGAWVEAWQIQKPDTAGGGAGASQPCISLKSGYERGGVTGGKAPCFYCLA